MDQATERDLIRRWQDDRDPKALDRLVRSQLRHVEQIASRYSSRRLSREDLIGEGAVGLLIAIERFDLERENRLVTYAAQWIRAMVTSAVSGACANGKTMVGATRSMVFWGITKHREALRCLYDDDDRVDELFARRVGVSVGALRNGMAGILTEWSMDAAFPGTEIEPYDVHDAGTPSPEHEFEEREMRDNCWALAHSALTVLDERERSIIQLRYLDDERVSLAEVGRRIGVSRERVRQLEGRALEKMRRRLGAAA